MSSGRGTQQASFDNTKELLTTTLTLSYYDSTKPTVVSADASSYGIGAVLMQSADGVLKLIAFASRTPSTVEQRYAQIEKEMSRCLGVREIPKISSWIEGIQTDHRPLVPLVNTKRIDDAPLRLRFLLRFNPIVEHVPGKQPVIVDTLPRKPLVGRESRIGDIELSDDMTALVDAVQQNWPVLPRLESKPRQIL